MQTCQGSDEPHEGVLENPTEAMLCSEACVNRERAKCTHMPRTCTRKRSHGAYGNPKTTFAIKKSPKQSGTGNQDVLGQQRQTPSEPTEPRPSRTRKKRKEPRNKHQRKHRNKKWNRKQEAPSEAREGRGSIHVQWEPPKHKVGEFTGKRHSGRRC